MTTSITIHLNQRQVHVGDVVEARDVHNNPRFVTDDGTVFWSKGAAELYTQLRGLLGRPLNGAAV